MALTGGGRVPSVRVAATRHQLGSEQRRAAGGHRRVPGPQGDPSSGVTMSLTLKQLVLSIQAIATAVACGLGMSSDTLPCSPTSGSRDPPPREPRLHESAVWGATQRSSGGGCRGRRRNQGLEEQGETRGPEAEGRQGLGTRGPATDHVQVSPCQGQVNKAGERPAPPDSERSPVWSSPGLSGCSRRPQAPGL